MKAGEAMSIRLSPEDIMTCIDVVKGAGINTYGMSLAQACKLGLAALCEGARAAGIAPRRDGFDYTAMTQPFKGHKQAKKLAVTNQMERAGISHITADLPQYRGVDFGTPIPADVDKKKRRMQELEIKLEADPINMSREEREELFDLKESLGMIGAAHG